MGRPFPRTRATVRGQWSMKQEVSASREAVQDQILPAICVEAQHRLGQTLRSFYERTVDGEPIPLDQVDLLLRLRHRERELQRQR